MAWFCVQTSVQGTDSVQCYVHGYQHYVQEQYFLKLKIYGDVDNFVLHYLVKQRLLPL